MNTRYYDKTEKIFSDKESKQENKLNKMGGTSLCNKKTKAYKKVFTDLRNVHKMSEKNAFRGKSDLKNLFYTKLINLVANKYLLIKLYVEFLICFRNEKKIKDPYHLQSNTSNTSKRIMNAVNYKMFESTSKLIKQEKYCWGTKKVKKLIVPNFMDEIISELIKRIIILIYQPHFENRNYSLVFRQGESPQHAIFYLTNKFTIGSIKAIHGKIGFVNGNLMLKQLIKILRKRIYDKKFLNLLKTKLIFDSNLSVNKVNTRVMKVKTELLYLFDIYMVEFDKLMSKNVFNVLDNRNRRLLNSNCRYKEKEILTFVKSVFTKQKSTIKRTIVWASQSTKVKTTKEFIEGLFPLHYEYKGGKSLTNNCCKTAIIGAICTKYKQMNKKYITLCSKSNKEVWRNFYVRHNSNWFSLGTINDQMWGLIEYKVSKSLRFKMNLMLYKNTLSLVNISKISASFLGFKIRMQKLGIIFAKVNRRVLLDKLYKKGYCNQRGFPKEISKLCNFNIFVITSLANRITFELLRYYAYFIKNPGKELVRWIYIVRYSCLKTIAQKYKTTVKRVSRFVKIEVS